MKIRVLHLSNVRVIMVIMRVPMVELLRQAAMKWIPVLKYQLSGVCEPRGQDGLG
jgi:hypothetical protein